MRPRFGLTVAITLIAVLATASTPQAEEGGGLLDLLGLNDAEVLDEFADPADIMAWADLPHSAKRGDEVTLKVTIENGREEGDFRLSTIDVGEEFMQGFKLLSVEPKPRQQDQLLGILTLEYPIDLSPGESVTYEIKLRATSAGVFIGDVDVYEGEQWLTRAAQIRVGE